MKALISACLLGVSCRYDGLSKQQVDWVREYPHVQWIPVCPEQMGGLATPRTSAERVGGQVMTEDGKDVTEAYVRGAEEVVRLAKMYGCELAILKERSPSCGHGTIYDGTFSRRLVEGSGVTAELLAKEGIRVVGESMAKEVLRG